MVLKCYSLFPIFRRYLATHKRFYKSTNILSNGKKYEITLDQRKLKTPLGKVFEVKSKPLAIAIAHEWDSQKGIINRSNMHLTSLACTVLDNPNKLTKMDIVNYIISFLETDTILFQSNTTENDSDELYKLQVEKWDPLIQWFCDRFQVDIIKTRSIDAPKISEKTRIALTQHFMSHNEEAVFGFMYAVDTIKSVILATATAERIINVEEAVALSRLEEEYQISYWGNVEWSHELNKFDLQARLSAAILFIHFNSYFVTSQPKTVSSTAT